MRYFYILLILGLNSVIAQNFDALDSLLKNEFKDSEPGGIVIIKKGAEVLYQRAIGLADIETKTPIAATTIFNTGSISKTFVSYGILILEGEGKLSIDDSITKYFKNFNNKNLASKIKVKHFLSHSSGIPDLRNVAENIDFYLSAKDSANFSPAMSMKKLNFEPGSKFQYSNPAFNGLALIIESITGEPWQDFVSKKIFKPSGMDDSRITNGSHPKKGVAHGYEKTNGEFKENDYGEFPTFAAAGNGGVWCSILDLVKYEEAIRSCTFLDTDGITKSRRVYVSKSWSSDTKPQLGFSWFISPPEDNDYGVKLVSHTGSQGGFRSFHYSVPEKNLTYIGLFNRPPTNMANIINKGLRLLENNNWMD